MINSALNDRLIFAHQLPVFEIPMDDAVYTVEADFEMETEYMTGDIVHSVKHDGVDVTLMMDDDELEALAYAIRSEQYPAEQLALFWN